MGKVMTIFKGFGSGLQPSEKANSRSSASFESLFAASNRAGSSGNRPSESGKPTDLKGGGAEPPEATTLAIGEEDGGGTIPVEPGGGIGDGAGPIPTDGDDPILTTLAIGEEDGGGGGGKPEPIGGQITGTKGDDVLDGSVGDDDIRGRDGNDIITTGQGTDRVNGGKGDDFIAVTGIGNKTIDGGQGNDTLELKGQKSNYAIMSRGNDTTIYTAPDGSKIVARGVETVSFAGVVDPVEPPPGTGFTASYQLAPNSIGATSLEISDGKAVLSGPDTNFTFTGVDPSALAADGPLIATGGSGVINGVETTALPLSEFGPAVLNVSLGFNVTGTQFVSANFSNGAMLDTQVVRPDIALA